MSEVEERRHKLLQETRKIYSDKNSPPAIHPRYQSAYRTLYEENDSSKPKHSFFIRLMIAAVLFGIFFVMDYHRENIGVVDSQTLIHHVEKDLFGERFPLFIEGF